MEHNMVLMHRTSSSIGKDHQQASECSQ